MLFLDFSVWFSLVQANEMSVIQLPPAKKLRKHNVFSHVCQCVCSEQSPYRAPLPQPHPCSNLFNLDLTKQGTAPLHPTPTGSNLFTMCVSKGTVTVGILSKWLLVSNCCCHDIATLDAKLATKSKIQVYISSNWILPAEFGFTL